MSSVFSRRLFTAWSVENKPMMYIQNGSLPPLMIEYIERWLKKKSGVAKHMPDSAFVSTSQQNIAGFNRHFRHKPGKVVWKGCCKRQQFRFIASLVLSLYMRRWRQSFEALTRARMAMGHTRNRLLLLTFRNPKNIAERRQCPEQRPVAPTLEETGWPMRQMFREKKHEIWCEIFENMWALAYVFGLSDCSPKKKDQNPVNISGIYMLWQEARSRNEDVHVPGSFDNIGWRQAWHVKNPRTLDPTWCHFTAVILRSR